jgi:hypothetical protein
MFGSVCLVGVAAAGGCLRKDCKTVRKRRKEKKNRLSHHQQHSLEMQQY